MNCITTNGWDLGVAIHLLTQKAASKCTPRCEVRIKPSKTIAQEWTEKQWTRSFSSLRADRSAVLGVQE